MSEFIAACLLPQKGLFAYPSKDFLQRMQNKRARLCTQMTKSGPRKSYAKLDNGQSWRRNRFSTVARGQCLEGSQRDGVCDEADRTIAEQDVDSPRMGRVQRNVGTEVMMPPCPRGHVDPAIAFQVDGVADGRGVKRPTIAGIATATGKLGPIEAHPGRVRLRATPIHAVSTRVKQEVPMFTDHHGIRGTIGDTGHLNPGVGAEDTIASHDAMRRDPQTYRWSVAAPSDCNVVGARTVDASAHSTVDHRR